MAEELPPPPSAADLSSIDPELHILPAHAQLWRMYFRGGSYPSVWDEFRSFGPTNARFDHHDPPPGIHASKAILYGADAIPTCVAEVFQETQVIDRRDREPYLVEFELAAPLPLLDVTGAWITRAGGNMAIGSGRRDRARAWSAVIYDAYPEVEGIRYPSSMHANQPAVALFERARDKLPVDPMLDLELSHPGLAGPLASAGDLLGYVMV